MLIECVDWINSKFDEAEYTKHIGQYPPGGPFDGDTRNWAETILKEFPESESLSKSERFFQAETK